MAIRDIIISTFSNIRLTTNPINVPLEEWLAKIKSGECCKSVIKEIRKSKDHNIQNELKTKLLSVGCVSGIFSERKDSALVLMNPVICLDLDDVKDIRTEYATLKENPSIVSIFLSPSGKGLKVVVYHDFTESDKHDLLYNYLGDVLNLKGRSDLIFDTKCGNVSRACFDSYSKEMYINKNPEPMHIETSALSKLRPINTKPVVLNSVPHQQVKVLTSRDEINAAILKEHEFFEKHYSMYPGNRNSNLFILASFLKEEGISEKDATDYLVAYYGDSDNGFAAEEIIKTINSSYKYE